LSQHLERLPLARADDMRFPDLALGFHDVIISFDHHERRAWICSSGLPETLATKRRARANERLREIMARVGSARPLDAPVVPGRTVEVTSNFARSAYEAGVQRVIDYILAGDIFQANLSQRFSAELPDEVTPWDLTDGSVHSIPRHSRRMSNSVRSCASRHPSVFSACRTLETCPIKGAPARGERRPRIAGSRRRSRAARKTAPRTS
jgi:para-aminobenzoate synthetase component 1